MASKVYCMSIGQDGPYGVIQMNSGSHMTCNAGSNLYVFGYIMGEGTIDVNANAKVFESLALDDYPGSGSNVSSLKSAGAFPFSSFAVKNTQVKMTLHAGASEQVYINIYGTRIGYNEIWVDLIGSIGSGATFKTSGYITKWYVPNSEVNGYQDKIPGKMYIDIGGDSSISGINMSLYGIEAGTSEFGGMPIPYNYTVTIKSGTTTLGEDVKLSKGSVAIIDSGATLEIPTGRKLYVLDGSDDCQAVGSGDAKLDVNGTIQVNGGLYTSTSGANITSSEKTGQIILNSNTPSQTSIKLKKSNSAGGSVTVVAAKLHNGDGS